MNPSRLLISRLGERILCVNLVWVVALIVLGAIAFDVFIFRDVLIGIFPYGDELPLRGDSAHIGSSWLSKGFSEYFLAYPEYTVPFANFVRPAVNFVYWIFEFDETGRYQVVFVNYLTHGLIAGLLFGLAFVHGRTRIESTLIGLVAFAMPAFWLTPMTTAPAFAFDGVSALLSLIALLCFSTGRSAWGAYFLRLVCFAKSPFCRLLLLFAFLVM